MSLSDKIPKCCCGKKRCLEGYIKTKEVSKFIKKLKEEIWNHESTFEGIKCKTCLPLDYIERIINEEAGKDLI